MKPGNIVKISGPNRRYGSFGRIESMNTFNAEVGPVCDLRKVERDDLIGVGWLPVGYPYGIMIYMVPAFDLTVVEETR